MNTYKSDIFNLVYQPVSFDEIFSAIQTKDTHDNMVKMWRGQGDITWPIHSSAFRRLSIETKTVTEKVVASYEKDLLESATHRGYRYQNGRELSDFELLARLQHHGAATRLVDATRNALVGLYFCAVGQPKKTGLLFGISVYNLGGYEGEPENRNYDEILDGLEKYEHPQTWEPPIVTERIVTQHSQFLYSHVSNKSSGSLALPVDNSDCLFLAITPTLKKRCLQILRDVFDIRLITLFPDIDGFGRANSHNVKGSERYRW